MRKTLYVARVRLASDLGEIEDLFATVADVQSQRLELIPESGTFPFGVFEMRTEQDAADCLERFNGQEFNGRQLSIVSERPKVLLAPTPSPTKTKGHRKHGRP